MFGNARPLSFGGKFFSSLYSTMAFEIPFVEKNSNVSQNLWNVSYRIIYTSLNSTTGLGEHKHFSAEGTYNSAMGTFCMVGCRLLDNSPETPMDCEIVISIQLSPLNLYNGERRHVNGTIRSTREKADPHFFEPLELSSNNVYQSEAIKSMWRMDMEIIMVMVSLTLVCVFIALQLFYVKKHRDVIPSISVTMLVITMLGYMIPLVLNFEAVFVRRQNTTNVLLWSGGWLEVTEVMVRVMTMVAFLLHFRLLQLAWTGKSSEEGRRGLWIAESKTFLLCLLLYSSGAIVSWSIHKRSNYPRVKSFDYNPNQNCLLMDYLRSYAGSIVDGYLLPQVILNIISGSKDKALTPQFYIGITLIRVMPHLYVPYRAQNFAQHLKSSYIYANPDEGIYSSAGNKVIPVTSILFAVLIFLQQRLGGKFLIPRRFRRRCGYETVPAIGLESYGDYGHLR
ncbi:uncharacterized protein A4U43_C01F13580 [Asparagus officinalis]|uniref:RING-type E3 ubiquitin transferase n=1 Tax=Asparagus officinalis TaxID=4686 RepID=A0A5P1FTM8_ASPOF|nr:uncharacterized protein A4U43_C01F13580 [Asparagus officinalis]